MPPLAGPEGPVRISFEGLLHTGKSLPGGGHFSAATLQDLLILVEYRDLAPGHHTQRVHLYGPDGALYQQFSTAFAVEGAGARPRAEAPPAHGPAHWSRVGAPPLRQVATRLPVGGDLDHPALPLRDLARGGLPGPGPDPDCLPERRLEPVTEVAA